MGHVEARGDTWGGFVDATFTNVGDNMDIALIWSPGEERMTGFELYGGLRYVDNDFHLVADPVPPALPTSEGGIDKNHTGALLGARYIAPALGLVAAQVQQRHLRRLQAL